MKKFYVFIFVAFICNSALFAQDIITLKNGEEIKAKVQEIGLDNVKYKKYENQAGPTYTLMKSDIFMIKYENGDKDVFTAPSTQQPTVPKQTEQSGQPTQTKQADNYAQIKNVIKNTSVPLRDKMYEIGIRLDGGFSAMYLNSTSANHKDETGYGFAAGPSIFCDIYPKKTSVWLLGTGVGWWAQTAMFDGADYNHSHVNWDLYFGARDPRVHLYMKVGPRLSFLTSATGYLDGSGYGEIDTYDGYNKVALGLIYEISYALKRWDFGIQAFWMFTNILKSDVMVSASISASGLYGVTGTIAYRLPF
jgi:hypothetical protein